MKLTKRIFFSDDTNYQNIQTFSKLTLRQKGIIVCNLFSLDFSIVLYFIGLVISYMTIVAEISGSNK